MASTPPASARHTGLAAAAPTDATGCGAMGGGASGFRWRILPACQQGRPTPSAPRAPAASVMASLEVDAATTAPGAVVVGAPLGVLSDWIHSLFVLLTTCAYALPVYEGIQRRSFFYIALFAVLGCVSFLMHCEETGICAPVTAATFARIRSLDLTLSYFLLQTMALVVLDIQLEVVGRVVSAVLSLALLARNIHDIRFNVTASACTAVALLVVDSLTYSRKFTPSWWRRIALVMALAGLAAILFRLLKLLWAWHGVWHLYHVAMCYVLLLAQRRKQAAARRSGASARAGGGDGGGAKATGAGVGIAAPFSTPAKRHGGIQAPHAAFAYGAAAPGGANGAGGGRGGGGSLSTV